LKFLARREDAQGMDEIRSDRWLAAAVDGGRWVLSTAITGPHGRSWPVSVASGRVDHPLYGGQAGVALLLGELALVTGEDDFMTAAGDAAHNVANAAAIGRFGLYSGLAGMALAVDRTAGLLGDERLGHDAETMVDRIVDSRVCAGDGVEWPAWANGRGPWQDLFHGTAGVGLALLRLGRAEVAIEAGSRLVELAIPAAVGHWWRSRPDDTRPAPNIAHGTAGVAYSLATIALVTGLREFADAAIAGAEYLLSVARTDGDTCAVHHDEGDGSALYTLGWCSGPPGLASLFIRLHQVTADDDWLSWAERAARTLTTSGIPARLYPGFWDNVGQCCGSAGVAEFFLGMHSYTGNPAYMTFASTVLDDLVDRGARDGAGLRWHNVDPGRTPPELPAETGYMQGAAGVGLALLHGYQAARGADPGPSLPDSPFRP
jgi:lantibiotic modifying enzyme